MTYQIRITLNGHNFVKTGLSWREAVEAVHAFGPKVQSAIHAVIEPDAPRHIPTSAQDTATPPATPPAAPSHEGA